MNVNFCQVPGNKQPLETQAQEVPTGTTENSASCPLIKKERKAVLPLAAHLLKLEPYREDQHGPCASMTPKFLKGSVFFLPLKGGELKWQQHREQDTLLKAHLQLLGLC